MNNAAKVTFDCGCFGLFWASGTFSLAGGNSCCKAHEAAGETSWEGKTVKAIHWPEASEPSLDALPEPGSNLWYHQRVIEARKAEAKAIERADAAEALLNSVRSLVCIPCDRPHPGDDDA